MNILLAIVLAANVWAAPGPRHDSQGRKSGHYETAGFFSGGNREVTSVRLKDIRRANSGEGFERIVFDLESNGASGGIPYYQVQLAPSENRLIVSIWSDVQYDFDLSKINRSFVKSTNVKKLSPVARVEEGLTVIELALASAKGDGHAFETFHLASPNRIIVDLQ